MLVPCYLGLSEVLLSKNFGHGRAFVYSTTSGINSIPLFLLADLEGVEQESF